MDRESSANGAHPGGTGAERGSGLALVSTHSPSTSLVAIVMTTGGKWSCTGDKGRQHIYSSHVVRWTATQRRARKCHDRFIGRA